MVSVDGNPLMFPVDYQGGQDYMFHAPGNVWSSAPNAAQALLNAAGRRSDAVGKDALFIPYRMAPTGGDFSTMVGETMISYAAANMPKDTLARFDKALSEVIPGWKGARDYESLVAYRNTTGDQRKAALQIMDRDFRNDGGISIGQARLSVTDPGQVNAPDYFTQNMGRILGGKGLATSHHNTYGGGMQGEGIGAFKEPFPVLDLVPEFAKRIGVTDHTKLDPTQAYTLRQNVLTGIIDEDVLRLIEARAGTSAP